MLIRAAFWSEERREAFHETIERCLLQPARRANADALDAVSERAANFLMGSRAQHPNSRDVDDTIAATIGALPRFVIDALLQHSILGSFARQSLTEVIRFSATTSISIQDLFNATEVAVRDGVCEVGEFGQFRIESNGLLVNLCVNVDGKTEHIEIPELGGLLPQAIERVSSIERALSDFGPTFRRGAKILAAMAERKLEESEFEALLRERTHGVRAHWERVRAGRDAPIVKATIAPGDLSYYSDMLGPVECTDDDVQSYIAGVLVPYRRSLVDGKRSAGLRVALFGFVHSSLAPSQFVDELSDDDVWGLVTELGKLNDPYSLLGLAEIGLSRFADERFRNMVGECISRLCADDDASNQMYVAAAHFARLVLSELQFVERSAGIQPYWKRMAAWMQAGVVLHAYTDFRFNLDALTDWVGENYGQNLSWPTS
ncbi:hypothetical protein [Cupriavidus basilensis]